MPFAPSTLPSIYNDSEPITSPLICRLLPIVAGSATVRDDGKVLEGRMVAASSVTAMGKGESVKVRHPLQLIAGQRLPFFLISLPSKFVPSQDRARFRSVVRCELRALAGA